MKPTVPPLAPDTLWPLVESITERALRTGALHPIPTDYEYVSDGGVDFLVRIISNLARKARDKRRQPQSKPDNPFLPYDAELFVADISDTHVGVLNKYNVVDHHLLVVTRHFEHQDLPLTRADFTAMWTCLAQVDGLAFYNGGVVAGASQPHRHLQIISLPLASRGPAVPIAPLLGAPDAPRTDDRSGTAQLPFRHAIDHGSDGWDHQDVAAAAERSWTRYHEMLVATGLCASRPADDARLPPYNLLATRRWMMLVPRSLELFEGVSINALGFAGALLVRDAKQLAALRDQGPLEVLASVGLPPLTPPSPTP